MCRREMEHARAANARLLKHVQVAESIVLNNEAALENHLSMHNEHQDAIVSHKQTVKNEGRASPAVDGSRSGRSSPRKGRVPALVKSFAKQIISVEKETEELEEELQRVRRQSSIKYRRSSISKPSFTLGHVTTMKKDAADLNPEDEFAAADADGDGILTRDEFSGWAAQKQELLLAVQKDLKALSAANKSLTEEVEANEGALQLSKQLKTFDRDIESITKDLKIENSVNEQLTSEMKASYTAMEAVRKRLDELHNEATMNKVSRSVLSAEEEEWEQEKKGMLKTWGEEVESLIISYQNDKALWDAKRDELTEELNAVGTS